MDSVVFDHFDGHEQVVFAADPASGLRCIVAIHSTALGPGLGGTRFKAYPTEEAALVDVLRLSRAMTYKNACAGLDHGGGKAVIIGDPAVLRSEALLRAYGRVIASLGGRYITACDIGTKPADMSVIRHETRWVTGMDPADGGSGDSGVLTAWGVYAGIKACLQHVSGDRSLAGRHVAVQGVGKVGRRLAEHLAADGARLTLADVDEPAVRDLAALLALGVATGPARHPSEPLQGTRLGAARLGTLSVGSSGAAPDPALLLRVLVRAFFSVLRLVLGDLAAHVVHVQRLGLLDEVLQGFLREAAGLGVQQHLVAEQHQGRDRHDLEGGGQLLLGLRVHLAEHGVGVALRHALEHGGEAPARPAPLRPEVHEHQPLRVQHGLLERVSGQLNGGHAYSSRLRLHLFAPRPTPRAFTLFHSDASGRGRARGADTQGAEARSAEAGSLERLRGMRT